MQRDRTKGEGCVMDLISREDALDCFHDWVDKYGDVHTADEMVEYQRIEALPPADRWIPCSERMPESTDEVLTTYIVNGEKKRRFVETASWYDSDEGYWSSPWDEYRVMGTKKEVIAWCELPEPWKGEE